MENLLKELEEFVEENPSEYGLELTVSDVKLIVKALEKQIPKKPNAYKDEYEHEFVPLCPTCKDWLVSAGERYCSKCGQAIRWKD